MSNKKRTHVGRPANEYPKLPRDCDHRSDNFSAGCQVLTAIAQDPTNPSQPTEEAEVVGHVLRITEIRCLECGQEFRFCNLPTTGDVMSIPLMLNGNRDMQTRIEPDLLVISGHESRGGKHKSRIITRLH